MQDMNASRRHHLKLMLAAGVCLSGLGACAQTHPPAIPWTTGTGRAKLAMPANATECHHHIYDHHYPLAPGAVLTPGDATVADYRLLQQRLGTSRNVIVQPSTYGTDNRLLLASIAQFGGRARGIAVVDDKVTQTELDTLDRGGVRGIRFKVVVPGPASIAMIKPLARRIAPMGWHVQVNATAAQILAVLRVWYGLLCPVVFDHLAHVPEPAALTHPAFMLVSDLLVQQKACVKLTGFYNESGVGAPTYADSVAVAAAYARAAPRPARPRHMG